MDAKTIREKILASQDLPSKPVKAWGMDCFVKTMTGSDRVAFESDSQIEDEKGLAKFDPESFREWFLIHTLCADEAGTEMIFTAEDLPRLKKKAFPEINRCLEVAQKLNSLIGEDLEKNLEKPKGGDSG